MDITRWIFILVMISLVGMAIYMTRGYAGRSFLPGPATYKNLLEAGQSSREDLAHRIDEGERSDELFEAIHTEYSFIGNGGKLQTAYIIEYEKGKPSEEVLNRTSRLFKRNLIGMMDINA